MTRPLALSDAQVAAALGRAAQLQQQHPCQPPSLVAQADHHGDHHGHTRADLVAAAAEVGIGGQFVDLAIAEQRRSPSLGASDRLAADDDPVLRIHRPIAAPVGTARTACCDVFESDAYGLRLRATTVADGGALTFEMPRLQALASRGRGYSQLAYRMEQLRAWTLQLHITPTGDHALATVTVDLSAGVPFNRGVARRCAAVSALAAAGTTAMVVGAASIALGLAVPIAAAAGLAMAAGCRALQRGAAKAAATELDLMMADVSASLARGQLHGGTAPRLPASDAACRHPPPAGCALGSDAACA